LVEDRVGLADQAACQQTFAGNFGLNQRTVRVDVVEHFVNPDTHFEPLEITRGRRLLGGALACTGLAPVDGEKAIRNLVVGFDSGHWGAPGCVLGATRWSREVWYSP